MRSLFVKIYRAIKDEHWKDPVWSKVISAAIITVSGSIITTLFLLIKSLFISISFEYSFDHIFSILKESTPTNNTVIILSLIYISFTIIYITKKLLIHIKHKFILDEKKQKKK